MILTIDKPEDWQEIAGIGGPVVDPMILRCGEIFLEGANGASNTPESWYILQQNLHAVGTFFTDSFLMSGSLSSIIPNHLRAFNSRFSQTSMTLKRCSLKFA